MIWAPITALAILLIGFFLIILEIAANERRK